jgi:hypothetical protein
MTPAEPAALRPSTDESSFWLYEYQKAVTNVRGLINRGQSESATRLIDGLIQRWQLGCQMKAENKSRAPGAVVVDLILAEITAERRRQIEVEGWTPYHDDEHGNAQLARAAAAYALNTAALTYPNVGSRKAIKAEAEAQWPWAVEWWKPTTPRRDLIKAAALIVAKIERLDRAKAAIDE